MFFGALQMMFGWMEKVKIKYFFVPHSTHSKLFKHLTNEGTTKNVGGSKKETFSFDNFISIHSFRLNAMLIKRLLIINHKKGRQKS